MLSSVSGNASRVEHRELSARERQILGLAASGMLDKEIASELKLSLNTLRTYWTRIREKLGHNTRAGLTAMFAREELGSTPPCKAVIDSDVPLGHTSDPEALRRAAMYYSTAFERVTDELKRLLRASQVLANWPRLSLNAHTDHELIDAVCRVFVDDGGYVLAWVGLAEHDAEKSIRVAGSRGEAEGFLDQVKFHWAEDVLGSGPSGTAIRTGETQIIQDFLADKRMAPWRATAQRCGLQSSATMPLRVGSEAFGFLAIYAKEADAFQDTEVKILEEIATDFASRLTEFPNTAEHH